MRSKLLDGVISMKISLDSNVFADQDFIEWLQSNNNKLSIHLSLMVGLETLYWYKLRGLKKSEFDYDISKLNAEIHDLTFPEIDMISDNAIKSNIKFKHHARDIIIGSHALHYNCILVTENAKDFQWMKENILSPDELVLRTVDKSEQ